MRVPPEVWIDRIKRLDALRDLVAQHIHSAREKQTREYNKGKRDVQFSEGDLVMRRTHPLTSGINKFSAKLAPKYERPLKIVELKSPTVYTLESVGEGNRRIAKVHVSELKRLFLLGRREKAERTNYSILCYRNQAEMSQGGASEENGVRQPPREELDGPPFPVEPRRH